MRSFLKTFGKTGMVLDSTRVTEGIKNIALIYELMYHMGCIANHIWSGEPGFTEENLMKCVIVQLWVKKAGKSPNFWEVIVSKPKKTQIKEIPKIAVSNGKQWEQKYCFQQLLIIRFIEAFRFAENWANQWIKFNLKPWALLSGCSCSVLRNVGMRLRSDEER